MDLTSRTDRIMEEYREAAEKAGFRHSPLLAVHATNQTEYLKMLQEAASLKVTRAHTAPVKATIPDQLCNEGFRFILLPAGKKGGGNEPGWQTTANYAWNDPRLQVHLEHGGNYGVFPARGSGNVILDADDYAGCRDARLLDGIEDQTLTIETGGSVTEQRKYHYFFTCNPPLEGKHPLYTEDGEHIGEIYCQHPDGAKGYVVGPNSIHPSGERYRVACDKPIAAIDGTTYASRLARLAPSRNGATSLQRPLAARTPTVPAPRSGRDGISLSTRLGLRVTDFLMPLNAKLRGGEWEGAHPVHPSSTGTNLTVSDETWFCRRHETGGGPLEALAVATGIIDCSEARPGCLRDKKIWAQVMAELRSRNYDVAPPIPDEPDLAAQREITDLCKTFYLTDSGNADRLVARYQHMIRYCHPRRAWLLWDTRRWLEDRYNLIVGLARETARKIYEEAGAEPNEDRRKALGLWARASESAPRVKAMVELATPDPEVAVRPADLDADGHLFNLENGTLDLRTFEFFEHRKDDMITKLAGVSFESTATCPKWEAHLDLIFGGDTNLIQSTQELLGYALLPGNPLQIFPIWWGDGSNGKSVTLAVIRAIFGEYAAAASSDLFMAQRQDGGPRPDLLALRGARFVTAVETEKGHRLNESLIKQMTGGDPVTARGLYKEMETFMPTHLAVLATNPKPIIRGVEYAIWRRVLMWPFAVTIPREKRITDYETVLLEEAPGILNWMLDGLRRYYANNCTITIPEQVRQATNQYKSDMDILAPFFAEECVLAYDAKIDRGVLYDRYVVWCQDLGDDVMTKRAFANALRERGIRDGGKSNGRRSWLGIRLKTQAEVVADEAAGSFQVSI